MIFQSFERREDRILMSQIKNVLLEIDREKMAKNIIETKTNKFAF
ncbi:hypothetical protein [Tissierella simiarum]|nr:hypothetical protein [Tissierella simiarum]